VADQGKTDYLRSDKEADKNKAEEKTTRADPLPIIVGLIFGLGVLLFAFLLIIGVQYGFIVL
jgi:hypothetical protein